MGDRARAKWAKKRAGLLCPFLWGQGGLGFHLTQCRLGRGIPPYQVAYWSIQPFGHKTPTLQTDRTGQRSDSIWRIVLQPVAQNRPTAESAANDVCFFRKFAGVKRCLATGRQTSELLRLSRFRWLTGKLYCILKYTATLRFVQRWWFSIQLMQ